MQVKTSQVTNYHNHKKHFCSITASVALVLILMPAVLLAQGSENASETLKEIRFGALSNIYPNISREDGRYTLELLMQKTMVKKAYPYSVKLLFFDPEPSLPNAIQSGRFHFVTLSTVDYLKIHKSVHLEPILIPSKIDRPTEKLLLLVRSGQTLSTIGQKEERTLNIVGGAIGELSRIWIDTILLGRGFPRSAEYFTKVKIVNKPGRAALPVFFSQADACVITQNALESMEELNPQIGRQLKILDRSEDLVRFIICATKEPTRKDIDTLVKESINMTLNPETQQTMTIIQMKRFFKFEPETLAYTEKLVLHHEKITGGRWKKNPPSTVNTQ